MELKTRMLRPPLTVMLVSSLLSASLSDSVNIRLVSGIGTCSGRVEVNVNGQWGTVCNDGWVMTHAESVCRKLGCGNAISVHSSASISKGSGPIQWARNVSCSGTEHITTECFQKHNCSHGEDAGVTCSGMENLSNLIQFSSL
ncbi:scavenger receptor cysteine-rich type 1 protein M130-like [Colossoma macropomum]|uniref:scavenger receptor cysteine-rich type 1 protein M130-like n=1 Tax=Colossoma macropomum TaxID=42526 RepID=UPI00186457FF|nr:scavenger receptor cysteine-rich type 1 protein M130-like [Colossoma macropomum]